jgi:antitoxin HigA-1
MMKNPSHPGRLIKSDIDALGLTVVEAAAGLGISRQQLHSVIAGRSGVTPEMAVRLEKALGANSRACILDQGETACAGGIGTLSELT